MGFFQDYGAQYKVDFLLMAAQGHQESGLDHGVKSRIGAGGVMQMPRPAGRGVGPKA